MTTRKRRPAILMSVVLALVSMDQGVNPDWIASAQHAGTKGKTDEIQRKLKTPLDAPKLQGYLKTELSVNRISAFGPANVWILAKQGDEKNIPHPIVLHSTDNGNTWQKRALDEVMHPYDMYFVDKNVGWISGADGMILQSTDGGMTWAKQQSPTESDLTFLQFVDRRFGWMGGKDGEFLRTTDGGKKWHSYSISGHAWVGNEFHGWLNAISFSDQLNGWFVGDHSKVFKTTDGGQSWKSQARAVERAVAKARGQTLNLTDVHFFSARKGILLADVIKDTAAGELHQALVLKTEDAGQTWRRTWAWTAGPFRFLNFVNELEGWMTIAFGRDLVRTTDGGKSWLGQDVPGVDPDNLITGGLFALKMIDSKRGWAAVSVNDYPILDKVVRTIDGGRTWREAKLSLR